ncbi:MAG: HAD family hydrolase [Alphaproteobacteria bacterium]|nr:HAD family hydrolase [Alphaproteobacteria bacterium]
MEKPAGILFDKDGTLLEYHATWMPANHAVALAMAQGDVKTAHYLLRAGGWDADTDRVASGSPLAAGDLEDIATLWHGLLPDDPERTIASIVAYMDSAFPANMVPTPVCDLTALLCQLETRNIALGVATADSINGLRLSLAPFDILHRFAFAVGFDSGHGRKPQPGMVHGFCEATGLKPDSVWVIGDNRHDIEMALAAGATGIGVLTGTSSASELRAAGATDVLTSIEELPAYLGA